MTEARIVSLIPSATEIVAALGCETQLVGRSHECDYPESVQVLPTLTAPKFDPRGSSAEIDRRVQELLRDSLSVYSVDANLLRDLKPTVIVTQAQCEVCAVSMEEVERATCDWLSDDARIISLEPLTVHDVLGDIRRVAHALGVPERGGVLTLTMRTRLDDIADRTANIADKPTVACIEWIEPLMAAGNWMPEIVRMAGGINLFGEAGKHSPWMNFDELQKADPDVIVALPCGFDIERTRQEMATLAGQPGFADLKAVREGRVYVTDGNQYFNRPGPRLLESLEILAEILHPTVFHFEHEGRSWEHYR